MACANCNAPAEDNGYPDLPNYCPACILESKARSLRNRADEAERKAVELRGQLRLPGTASANDAGEG